VLSVAFPRAIFSVLMILQAGHFPFSCPFTYVAAPTPRMRVTPARAPTGDAQQYRFDCAVCFVDGQCVCGTSPFLLDVITNLDLNKMQICFQHSSLRVRSQPILVALGLVAF